MAAVANGEGSVTVQVGEIELDLCAVNGADQLSGEILDVACDAPRRLIDSPGRTVAIVVEMVQLAGALIPGAVLLFCLGSGRTTSAEGVEVPHGAQRVGLLLVDEVVDEVGGSDPTRLGCDVAELVVGEALVRQSVGTVVTVPLGAGGAAATLAVEGSIGGLGQAIAVAVERVPMDRARARQVGIFAAGETPVIVVQVPAMPSVTGDLACPLRVRTGQRPPRRWSADQRCADSAGWWGCRPGHMCQWW